MLAESADRTTQAAWEGHLELRFEERGGLTGIARRRHRGPLMVQRAFAQDDGSCHVYVLHPPGGVVGGDRLRVEATLLPGCRALLTTPAATKAYRSPNRPSLLTQSFAVGAGALLEWLPQETIVFDGAWLHSSTSVELAATAQFAGWEVCCLGRNDLGFSRGEVEQRLVLTRLGRRLFIERGCFAGGGRVLQAPWGLAGRSVFGTFVKTGGSAEEVDALRELLPSTELDWFSVSLLGEVLVCRYLGYRAEAAKRLFAAAWTRLHLSSGRVAVPPRVWAT